MRMTALLVLALPLGLLVACTGTGASDRAASEPCEGREQRGFIVQLASSRGGAATPEEAAEKQSGRIGWRVARTDSNGASLWADRATRHAISGSDGTWFIDSGIDC